MHFLNGLINYENESYILLDEPFYDYIREEEVVLCFACKKSESIDCASHIFIWEKLSDSEDKLLWAVQFTLKALLCQALIVLLRNTL